MQEIMYKQDSEDIYEVVLVIFYENLNIISLKTLLSSFSSYS